MSCGTVVKLHDKSAEQFPKARSKAELKIHTVVGITGSTKSIAVYPGKTAEVKTVRLGPWVKDNILLFDLGYFKYELFSRIKKNKGYFVSRLKQSANPTIISVTRARRENPVDMAGKILKEVLSQIKGGTVDVEVEVSLKGKARKTSPDGTFEIYHPVRSTPKAKETFRLYLTNITPEQLSAEDVALLYRVRWSVELVFEELKRLYQLDVIPSGVPAVLEFLVLVAMLTMW